MTFRRDDIARIARDTPPPREERRRCESSVAHALSVLESELQAGHAPRYLYFGSRASFPGMAPSLVRRAEALVRRVWVTGGSGSVDTQLALMGAIAVATDPASLPFFRESIERKVSREQAGPGRRAFALLGLALCARRGSEDAKAELCKYLGDAVSELRAAAVEAISLAFVDELPGDFYPQFDAIASGDAAFAPRFLARRMLAEVGVDPVLDVPDGSYTFKVALRREGDVSRTIELRSDHSLHTLAGAVLDAFDWDDDHLYCFHFDGRERGGLFTIGPDVDLPEGSDGMGVLLGELGLGPRQRFTFRFDFGDNHLFDIAVVAVTAKAPAQDALPRVVEETGISPPQYPEW